MPLFGTLQTMPLPDLLQWIGAARLTGTLQVERNRVSKAILFQEGQVVGCSSDDPPERLGQFLIARGKISEEQLRQGLAKQERERRHLGMILVELGALSPTDLASHLEAKAEETVFSLFEWQDATFRFQQGVCDQSAVFPMRLRVEDVLLRGLKRYDEIRLIRQVFPTNGVVLRRTAKRAPEALLQHPMGCSLYEAIDGERTIAEILLHAHGAEYPVTKFLFELQRGGFAEIIGERELLTEPAPPPAPQPEPAAAAVTTAAPGPLDEWGPELTLDLPEDSIPFAPPAAVAPPASRPEATGVEASERSEAYRLQQTLDEARRRMAATDFDGALEILNGLYRDYPGDESLRRLVAEAEVAFTEKAYRHYLPPGKVPHVTKRTEDLTAERLSPTEFFLLSRIDGVWDVKSIIQIAPLREVETLLALKRLRERKIIDLQDPPPPARH